MANFEIALAKTLAFEGGYSNNSNDAGGETYCGISRKFWPKWEGWRYVDNRGASSPSIQATINAYKELEKLVADFYRTNFWLPLRADEIQSQEIANYLFDFAVNSGISDAVKALQKACNSFFASYKIETDGVIGTKTLTVVDGIDEQDALIRQFKCNRLHHILKNIGNDKIHPSFAKGLADRALNA